MARVTTFKCDGCDGQVEQSGESVLLPVGWSAASVVCDDGGDGKWEQTFDVCGPCSRRMDPRTWPRLASAKASMGRMGA
jgi:hypothetical protein